MTNSPNHYGEARVRHDIPVAIPGELVNIGTVLLNAYLKHFLGPRASGRVLNVGAGSASVTFRQREMFAATEYHTLETPSSGIPATYVCSATSIGQVPDDSYDWIYSTSVLEHVDDPWAAAREQMRICKPGGYIYAHVPFAQPVHLQSSFTDYWRFTPEGLRKLYDGAVAREFEIWGDDPGNPNSYAVLFQKQPGNPLDGRPQVRWFEYPNEQPFYVIRMSPETVLEWPVYDVLIEPMNLAMQLHDAWTKMTAQYELDIPHGMVVRKFANQFRHRTGTLRTRGVQSTFERTE